MPTSGPAGTERPGAEINTSFFARFPGQWPGLV